MKYVYSFLDFLLWKVKQSCEHQVPVDYVPQIRFSVYAKKEGRI